MSQSAPRAPLPPQFSAAFFDRHLHAAEARFTGFLSPASLLIAYLDWMLHLANAPGRRLDLARLALRQTVRLFHPDQWIPPAPGDRRFRNPAWREAPFNFFSQAFLLTEDWWRAATMPLPGVAASHAQVVSFAARQMLDVFSPSNFAATNPEVLRVTWNRGGLNFLAGWRNLLSDLENLADSRERADRTGFAVGRDVAVTPGKIIFRNALMELIQYAPSTAQVRPEPILIVPAWIMKYYILDLSPQNSLVRYLVSQGYTVFCISWRNPGEELRDTGLDDYRTEGVMAALAAIDAICGTVKVHGCGYCLGGTLLTIAAAAMARDKDPHFASIALLAAQTDFSEAGELQLFTDESQLALLDDVMWRQGYLDSTQMAGAFQILRSNDLIWSRMIKSYLMGEQPPLNDLMAWNADATRMPFRMHSEYLHSMFLRNDLAEGRYLAGGSPVAVSEITCPIFAVSTETDHVAPWRSVYKIHLLNEGDITFALTSGGHNAGIVNEPGHPGRHYHIARRRRGEAYMAPDIWQKAAEERQGSWWPAYIAWLDERSAPPAAPPEMGNREAGYAALCEAPGTYVRMP